MKPTPKYSPHWAMMTEKQIHEGLSLRKGTLHIRSEAQFWHRMYIRISVSETPDSKRYFNVFLDMNRATPIVLLEPKRVNVQSQSFGYMDNRLTVTVFSKAITFTDVDGNSETFPVRESLSGLQLVPFYDRKYRIRKHNIYSVDDLIPVCKTLAPLSTFPGSSLRFMIKTAREQH